MRKNKVILALLVAVSTSLMVSSAQAQQWNGGRDGGWNSGRDGGRNGGWNNGRGGQGDWQRPGADQGQAQFQDQASATINSYVQNQTLDLSSILNLTQPYRRGEVVDSVVIYTSGQQYYGNALTLIADGRVVASDNSGFSMVTLYPYQLVQLNGYLGQVLLQVQGTVYISQIVVNMHRVTPTPQPPPPPPPVPTPTPIPQPPPPSQGQIVLSADLSMVGSSGRVELTSLMNLNAYRGYRLQSLIITGRAVVQAGQGVATLTMNGNISAGQVAFDGLTRQQSIPLRGAWIAGVNVQRMDLDLQGVQARDVQLVLSR